MLMWRTTSPLFCNQPSSATRSSPHKGTCPKKLKKNCVWESLTRLGFLKQWVEQSSFGEGLKAICSSLVVAILVTVWCAKSLSVGTESTWRLQLGSCILSHQPNKAWYKACQPLTTTPDPHCASTRIAQLLYKTVRLCLFAYCFLLICPWLYLLGLWWSHFTFLQDIELSIHKETEHTPYI